MAASPFPPYGRGPRRSADLAGRDLRWIKSNGYELRDGDDVVATLRFRSRWGSLATAESADGCWTFKRVGFLQTLGGETTAVGKLQGAAANTSCWMTKFAFSTEAGEPLVRFTKIFGLLKLSSTVDILPAATDQSAPPWLVMLGWYLTIQMHNDAGASAAAVSAAT